MFLYELAFWGFFEYISFLNIYPGVELLDHMVVLFLVFRGIFILFSIEASPIYVPTNGI